MLSTQNWKLKKKVDKLLFVFIKNDDYYNWTQKMKNQFLYENRDKQ